ncbi:MULTISPECIES: hypothetical protein [unclassified Flavobacterium]|uniref:hypothetical protein n=1 Tax=unclassified Flavobacterium TaxID=196869 RepID=UPI001291EED1|nr:MULTISPECIES: hypothetical protein [unclassified Flavobacterium]MQP52289.1 hypothetical protein [Flavobacterium sp. LMO9]MQP62359.1 hypothetical protein [Flavobacterium sp. LMO6]
MKKISVIFCLFLSSISFSQTNLDTIASPILTKKNEVKLDVLNLISNGRLGITYERFLNNDFSVGITGMFLNKSSKKDNFSTDDTRTLIDYQIIPYVRYALSKSAVNLYYLEAFTSINGGQYKELVTLNNGVADYVVTSVKEYNDLAIGASAGYKFYIKESFVVDITIGMGKNLFHAESPKDISRLGINLGYRF